MILNILKKASFAAILICAALPAWSAQTFTTISTFKCSTLEWPAPLIQGTDGNLYGTVYFPAQVFRLTTSGNRTMLHGFAGPDGEYPWAGLVEGADGNFYGTTSAGGLNDGGTIFRITPVGDLTTLFNFDYGVSGANPIGALVQGLDGAFYGTAEGGPTESGTQFKITSTGAFTLLNDAYEPNTGLILGFDGDLYGGSGGIFKMTPQGVITNLDYFTNLQGSDLNTPVQAPDGNFYGTAYAGGANSCGTIFKVSPTGAITTLNTLSCDDGFASPLIRATDGNFYGTSTGGSHIFRVTPAGELTTLYVTPTGEDGFSPSEALVQHTDGQFYGIGKFSDGEVCSVYSFSVGLAPFVKTLPPAAPAGTIISILGTDLTGATSVTFNGIPAAFTVVSASLITATIPDGATTGNIEVTTPGATLVSNAPFRVLPVIGSFAPNSGPAGTVLVITGDSFTGATSVSLGGVNAPNLTVNTDTQITATVPSGASTGRIYVTTRGGTAASAANFIVN